MAVAGEAMRGIGRTETSFAHILVTAGGVRHSVKRGASTRCASRIDAKERTTEAPEHRTLNGPKGEETQHV